MSSRRAYGVAATRWACLQLVSPVFLLLGLRKEIWGGTSMSDDDPTLADVVIVACFLVSLLVTTAMLARALFRFARDRGRSPAWCVTAVLGPFGVLLLN